MKTKNKVLLISGIILFSLLASFTYACQSTILTLCNKKLDNDYSNVLRLANKNNKEFGNRSLSEVHLLASHDALSYEINHKSGPNVNETDHIVNDKFLFTVGKGAFVRLAKAQRHNALTQLKGGARLLDARITFIDGVYYTSHGVISHPLKESVLEILSFLNENPGEFIIFYINNYYEGESNDQKLFDYISSIKLSDKSLFDYVNYDIVNENKCNDLTYNKLTSNGEKAGVMFVYSQHEQSSYSDYFKFSSRYSEHWSLTKSSDKDEEINSHVRNMPENFDGLRILQGQLTCSEDDIIGTLIGWSLLDMGEDCNAYMIDNPNLDYWLGKLPIYLCDYCTSMKNDFNNRINKKLLELNCK